MKKLPFLLSISAIGFGLLYVCGSSSSGDDDGLIAFDAGPDVKFNPDAPDQNLGMGKAFCDQTLGLIKTALDSCCTPTEKTAATIALFSGIDDAIMQCETTLEASIADHRTAPDPGPYAACINAYKALFGAAGTAACGAVDAYRVGDIVSQSCLAPFKGHGTLGSDCNGDYDCTSGFACVGYTASASGKCTALVPVDGVCGQGPGAITPAVDNVVPEINSCNSGFYCKGGACKAQLPQGGSCTSNVQCQNNFCVDNACATAAPLNPGVEGFPCAAGRDCNPGLFCNTSGVSADGGPASSTCTQSLENATACQPSVDHQCLGKCTSGNVCEPSCGFPN